MMAESGRATARRIAAYIAGRRGARSAGRGRRHGASVPRRLARRRDRRRRRAGRPHRARDRRRVEAAGGGRRCFSGAPPAAPFAALANGTLAHCLDFDDTYIGAVTHTSAPVWAATLALGEELGADEGAMLRAFVAGFETASRLGRGLGEAVTAHGFTAPACSAASAPPPPRPPCSGSTRTRRSTRSARRRRKPAA